MWLCMLDVQCFFFYVNGMIEFLTVLQLGFSVDDLPGSLFIPGLTFFFLTYQEVFNLFPTDENLGCF